MNEYYQTDFLMFFSINENDLDDYNYNYNSTDNNNNSIIISDSSFQNI